MSKLTTVKKTAWNHSIKIGTADHSSYEDATFVVVEFENGKRMRSIRTFKTDVAEAKATQLMEYVVKNQFPFVNADGDKQFKDLPAATMEF